MRPAALVFAIFVFGVSRSDAQTVDDLNISVEGFEARLVGGEVSHVSRGTGPIVIGRPTVGYWSTSDCAYFSVSSREGSFKEGSAADWIVEVTPLEVEDRTVTFRLKWARFTGERRTEAAMRAEAQLILRAGQSLTIDSVPVPVGAETFDGRPCDATDALLRVSVQNREKWDEMRLYGVDLWLVDRQSSGSERTQALSVRGLPHHPMPFYFDSVNDGTASLNILGDVVASPANGAIQLFLETISRLPEPPTPSHVAPARWFNSSVRATPGEVVEIALPKLDEAAGPFASHAFALRVRVRQIR
jgi:hypothetical protein